MSINTENVEITSFEISEEDIQNHKRLDSFLAKKFPDFSRSYLKKLFQDGEIYSESKIELKRMPKVGTVIYFKKLEAKETELIPQDIPLKILFEDEHLIIINKQAGLVVHPAPGNYDGTLVNAILHHCPNLKGIGNEKRPGIVHRLDKGTSGVMVVAKDQKTHEGLVKLFSTHDIDRIYEAICLGAKIPPAIDLESTIGRNPNNRLKMAVNVKNGKRALTHLKVLDYFEKLSHVQLKLETGRTHQIRVHLSQLLKNPILNDQLYGRTKEEKQMVSGEVRKILKDYEHPFLHARVLGFIHPITNEKIYIESPPPKIFQDVLKQLGKESGKSV